MELFELIIKEYGSVSDSNNECLAEVINDTLQMLDKRYKNDFWELWTEYCEDRNMCTRCGWKLEKEEIKDPREYQGFETYEIINKWSCSNPLCRR